MNRGFLTFSFGIAGVFSIITGMGILITDEPLMQLCRRGCWINSLLYGIFGDYYGKLIYGGLGCIIGVSLLMICFYRAVKKPA